MLLALAFLGLYVATIPANHTEAEDAYAYAYQVENLPILETVHPHHVLYGPFCSLTFRIISKFFPTVRAFPIMIGISLVAAVLLLLLFFRYCTCGLGFPSFTAALATSGLGLSYGFWRYACEAEIYLPASLIGLLLISSAHTVPSSYRQAIGKGLLAACAVLIHVLLIPYVIAIVLSAYRGAPRRILGTYLLTAVMSLALAYGLIVDAPQAKDGASHGGMATRVQKLTENLHPATVIKGAAGASQSLISGNFLFGFPGFAQRLQSVFPSRNFTEEQFMGQHAPAFTRHFPPITLFCMVITGFWGIFLRVRKRVTRSATTECFIELGVIRRTASITLVIFGLIILLAEPGNPELWILAHVPLWLLLAVSIIQTFTARKQWIPPMLFVMMLGIHNAIGGMACIASSAGDYNGRKAASILRAACKDDVIITADSQVFVRYLRYHTKGKVEDLRGHSFRSLMDAYTQAAKGQGARFVLGDVLSPPLYLAARDIFRYNELCEFGRVISPTLMPLYADHFGGAYISKE